MFRNLGYSAIKNLSYRFRHKPVTRIALYHDMFPGTLGFFESHLRLLKEKTHVVNLDDYFSGKLSSEKINIVITFDDGYKSWVTHAIPILKRMRLTATFFISSGFIGLSKKEEADFLRTKMFLKLGPRETTGGLSIEDIRKIVQEGFSVGGHTMNHRLLDGSLDDSELRHEIADDRINLERMTGTPVKYFAYPFGIYHHPEIDLSRVLRESGYQGALTTTSGINSVESDPYRLHRELVSADMPARVFRARIYGNMDPVHFLKKQLRTIRQRR